ncbi:unnamed protein product [Arabis nemorensis]|uniref:Importin subunit alpha n=1 Tax=Arabis nemorensis TaxID=586526 RepID=A0A565C0D9_9BRAS|nr:unnamed protein product [Arabis nemorensis]
MSTSTKTEVVLPNGDVSSTKILLENLPVLLGGIWTENSNIQLKATNILRSLVSSDYEPHTDGVIQLILLKPALPFLERLVQLTDEESSVLFPALRTIGNIVYGDKHQAQTVLDHQVLPRLLNLITNNYEKKIKKEACWIISNITAGNSNQIQAVIEAGIIQSLCLGSEFKVKKEAAWGISNAICGGTHDQIRFMVSQGCIKPICDILACPDPVIITACLEALEDILVVGEAEKNLGHTGDNNLYASMIDEAEGLEKIVKLQRHDNNEIYQKAAKILETFWTEDGDKEGNDENHAPFGFVLLLDRLTDDVTERPNGNRTRKGTADEEETPDSRLPQSRGFLRRRTSIIDENSMILLDNIPVLLAGIWQDDYHSQLKATITLRRLVTTDFKPHTDGVIQLNVLPRLLKFLSDKDFPKLQYEAAWALTNISAENTKVIVEIGAVPRFIKLLGGGSARKVVRELSIGALGNIAGDSPEYRDLVLRHSAMTPLLSQFKKPMNLRALRDAARTLSNFCSGKPQPSFEQTKPALPVLERLVQSKDEEVLTETCSALSYLSDGPNDRRQAVINAGIVPHLVKLVSHPSPSVLIRVLHTIGNIVTGGDDDETLVTVLQTADFEVKEEEAACEISKATHMQIE